MAATFGQLREKGHPTYRIYYADVAGVDVLDDHTVRFRFANTKNRELALILGQLPVLPKAWLDSHDLGAGTLEPIPGSGPYRVARAEAGPHAGDGAGEGLLGQRPAGECGPVQFRPHRHRLLPR